MKQVTIKALSFMSLAYIFIFLLFACKKNEETEGTGKQWLMTIKFKNDFINPKLNAIVFISDAAGKPLADTMISGNPTIMLYTKEKATPPLRVTVANWEPDMHNFLVTIQTFTHVMPSVWTILGERPVSAGEAIVNLENVPAHTGPVLYANSGHSNLTFETAGSKHPVFTSPDDLYIMLKTATGPFFKWEKGILAGESYNIDLTAMESAATKVIAFPGLVQDYHVKISGYKDPGDLLNLPIATDELIGDGTKTGEVSVSYPPAVFENFRTDMQMIESWNSPYSYLYSKFGPVPESFVKLDATVNLVSTASGYAHFQSIGTFTLSAASWNFTDAQNLAFDWTVYGPDTLTTITLPELPPSMQRMFPTLAPDSLRLTRFEPVRYPDFSTYSLFLEKLFNPEGPLDKNKLESSSVIISVD